MHNAFAEALDDCQILVMSRADLERLILNRPALGLRMLETTGSRLRDAEKRLEDMAFKVSPPGWPRFSCAWPRARLE